METDERTTLVDNVRAALTQLQNALEELPDSAAVISAYLPGTGTCDGLVGGTIEGLDYAVTDVLERVCGYVCEQTSLDQARSMLQHALDTALASEKGADK